MDDTAGRHQKLQLVPRNHLDKGEGSREGTGEDEDRGGTQRRRLNGGGREEGKGLGPMSLADAVTGHFFG